MPSEVEVHGVFATYSRGWKVRGDHPQMQSLLDRLEEERQEIGSTPGNPWPEKDAAEYVVEQLGGTVINPGKPLLFDPNAGVA